ncbi:hypothetical protein [Clavibacter tessellarius]|uniref:hypothetical protein n=1 Tax=Clavibacter tessellarius TaxID=31965 RepID=UPI0032540FA2
MDNARSWGIEDLDGRACTEVGHEVGPWQVLIGGGPDRFMVTASAENGLRIANALSVAEDDDHDEDDTIDLTVGGQDIDCPRRYALTRDEALAALGDLQSGSLDVSRWELFGDA